MTASLRTTLLLSIAFEHAKRSRPSSVSVQQVELRFMSRLSRLRRDLTVVRNTTRSLDDVRTDAGLPELPAYVPFNPLTLSTTQQAALVSLRVSQVKGAVVRKLLEDSQDGYRGPDFAVLRDLGLAEWMRGKRLHELTGAGRVAADTLEKALCKRLGIHLLLQSSALTEQQSASCSCGEWTRSFNRGGRRMFIEIYNSHGRHVESVTAVQSIYTALKPAEAV